MTPYELSLHVDVFAEKQKQEYEDKVTIIYLGEYLHRVEKMPSLNELLGKEDNPGQMTDDEMLQKVKQLNALFGGIVEERQVR